MWKKRKQTIEHVKHPETATALGSQGLLYEISELLRHILRATRILVPTAIVLVIVTFALQLQVSSRNEDIKQTKVTSAEAKQAASDAKQAVEDAVKQVREGQTVDPAAIATALQSIARIEFYLCNGPCPTNEGTEGTSN